jgi:hypothetical protein
VVLAAPAALVVLLREHRPTAAQGLAPLPANPVVVQVPAAPAALADRPNR